LSFAAPTRVRFKYQLEGFDSNWIDAGTQRPALVHREPRRKPGMLIRSGKCSCECQSPNSERCSGRMVHHMATAALPKSDIPASAFLSEFGKPLTRTIQHQGHGNDQPDRVRPPDMQIRDTRE